MAHDVAIRPSAGLAPLVALVAAGAAVGVLVWLGLSHGGHPVRPALVIGIGVVAGVVLAALRVVAAQVPVPPRRELPTAYARTDRERGGQGRLARILDSGIDSADRFELRVRPLLASLAEHRMRCGYGVELRADRAADREAARQLLGDELFRALRVPARVPPSRAQLADWVARIEGLTGRAEEGT